MAEAPKSLKDVRRQQYYDSLFDMHGSLGWMELMIDLEAMEIEHNKVDTCSNAEELHYRRGQLDIIRWLKTHKERTEAFYSNEIEEQEGVPQDFDPTGGVAKVIS